MSKRDEVKNLLERNAELLDLLHSERVNYDRLTECHERQSKILAALLKDRNEWKRLAGGGETDGKKRKEKP